jgi:hypothetical protein
MDGRHVVVAQTEVAERFEQALDAAYALGVPRRAAGRFEKYRSILVEAASFSYPRVFQWATDPPKRNRQAPRRTTACYALYVAFAADVLVMARDVPDVRLVAEVKRNIRDLAQAESQLRRYMLDRKCSLGLLVTPLHTRIYRDTFADFTEGSVQLVGEFSTAEVLDVDEAPDTEHALQEAVREWLDHLAAAWPSALPKTDAARAPVVQYLVPEVADGRVSSGSMG